MNVISLFSGIGGFDLGLERAGFTVVAQVENDAFCQRVLERRWPGVPRAGDVRSAFCSEWTRSSGGNFPAAEGAEWANGQGGLGSVDLLVGGFPCQDLSVAGKRAGLGGSRSSLFYEYIRIAKALAPTWGIVENVPGLVSSHRGRDFWTVLQGLRECWPVVGWRIVDSQHFGVPQRRRRVFLVGGPTEASVSEILALTESGGGDLAASGQAGTDVAYALAAGVGNRFGSGRDAQDTFVTAFDPTAGRDDRIYSDGTAPGLKVGSGIGIPWAPAIPTHALTGEGHDASEDGTGRGTPLVACLDLADTLSIGANQTMGFPGDLGPAIGSTIRRLTPLECERLQGFPDGWTCLCQPLEVYATDPDAAALACRCPDSPRYRALGNAVTVPVITYLGERIRRQR